MTWVNMNTGQRTIYGNFSDKSIFEIRRELLEKIRKEKPEIQYKDTPRKTWFIHADSMTDDPQVLENYLTMVRLNDPNNIEELKDLIYSTKVEYDSWGILLPTWGIVSTASLKEYYLVSREYYECKRTTNY
jgi:hypothetical protein